MLFNYIINITNSELGDSIPKTIQDLISNLQDGKLTDLNKINLGSKKIIIERTKIEIEDENPNENNNKNRKNPSSSIQRFQNLNKKIDFNKSENSPLIEKPKILENSERISNQSNFPMENLVSFIKDLESNLEQMTESEQNKNTDFDVLTDKGRVHLKRITINNNDIKKYNETEKLRKATNNYQSSSIDKSIKDIKTPFLLKEKEIEDKLKKLNSLDIEKQIPIEFNKQKNNIFSQSKLNNFITSSFNDIYKKENINTSNLSESTETGKTIKNADDIKQTTQTTPVDNQSPIQELNKNIIGTKVEEDHESEKVIADKSVNVSEQMDDIINKGIDKVKEKNEKQPLETNITAEKNKLINNKKDLKLDTMTPNSLTPNKEVKPPNSKPTPASIVKKSSLFDNLNYNLGDSTLKLKANNSSNGSEFLSQLKNIFNKMGTSSSFNGLENDFIDEATDSDSEDDEDDE